MVPRRQITHRGVQLNDLDLAAVLAPAPVVALVDELAHTDVGSDNSVYTPGESRQSSLLSAAAVIAGGY